MATCMGRAGITTKPQSAAGAAQGRDMGSEQEWLAWLRRALPRLLRGTASTALALMACACIEVPTVEDADLANPSEVEKFSQSIGALISANLHYPKVEQTAGIEGALLAYIVVNRQGEVLARSVVVSGGNQDFNQETLTVWDRMMAQGIRFPNHRSTPPRSNVMAILEPVDFCLNAKTLCAPAQELRNRLASANSLAWKGKSDYNAGKLSVALKEINKSLTQLPLPEAVLLRGEIFNKLGSYDDAIADFDKTLAWNPFDCWVYAQRGLAREKKGDVAGAFNDYNNGITTCPDYPELYLHRGDLYNGQSKIDQALADYSKAIDLVDPLSSRAFDLRARVCEAEGHRDEALIDYKKALELDPNDHSAATGIQRLGAANP
jgi:Flp pilus assembly protein TadD